MRLVVWLLRGFVFFALFAFALNNQQPAAVNWFFGAQWQAPMVIVVLAAFGAGCAVGVVATLPGWWRRRRGEAPEPMPERPATPLGTATGPPSSLQAEHPLREGL
jgi:uncharacterized integral membrane protein